MYSINSKMEIEMLHCSAALGSARAVLYCAACYDKPSLGGPIISASKKVESSLEKNNDRAIYQCENVEPGSTPNEAARLRPDERVSLYLVTRNVAVQQQRSAAAAAARRSQKPVPA